jgi:hypothetical protein
MRVTIRTTSNLGANRGCGMVFCGAVVLGGLAIFALLSYLLIGRLWPYFWTQTPCTIVESSVVELTEQSDYGHRHEARLKYHYLFKGQPYDSTNARASGAKFDKPSEARHFQRRYVAGQSAVCFVNFNKPWESVLERDSLWFVLFLIIPLGIAAAGVGGLRKARRKPDDEEPSISDRQTKAGGKSVLGLRIFGSVFLLFGLAFGYGFSVRPWLHARVAADWVETPCTILSSRIASHDGTDGGSTYSLEVRYEYVAGGEKRIGDRYDFSEGNSSSLGWREKARAALPKGRKTVCFVDPGDPDEAVLVRELGPDKWFGLIPLVFALVGLAIIIGAPAMNRKKALAPTGLPGAEPESSPALSAPGGLVEIPSSEKRVGTFLGITLFALFWNGFVWGIYLFSKPPQMVKVFLSIFLFVGALAALAAIGAFLAIFNPKPSLFASGRRVSLGNSLQVQYRFSGNVRRLKRLRLSLRGQEISTSQRGSSTATDKHVFVDLPLLDTTDHTVMAQGTLHVEVPRDTMHSFEGTNNRIAWAFHLHGDFALWPRVKADFAIVVLPLPSSSTHA